MDDSGTMSLFTAAGALGSPAEESRSKQVLTGSRIWHKICQTNVRGYTTQSISDWYVFRDYLIGNDVWLGMPRILSAGGKATISEIIACLDVIMVYLIRKD